MSIIKCLFVIVWNENSFVADVSPLAIQTDMDEFVLVCCNFFVYWRKVKSPTGNESEFLVLLENDNVV